MLVGEGAISHPLDLHPCHKTAAAAWTITKRPEQPEFADLPVTYRSELLDLAAAALAGGEIPNTDDPRHVFQRQVVVSREAEEGVVVPDEVKEELQAEVDDEVKSEEDEPEIAAPPKQGRLPDDFPGYTALDNVGEATYAKVRKRIAAGTLKEIEGIGAATEAKIEQRMTGTE